MINHLSNLCPRVLSDKWCFNSSQNWKTLALDFDSFSTDDITDKTFQAFGFHISATRYLEEGSLCFINIINLELNAELAMIDHPGQVVIDSGEEVAKKKNECAAKKNVPVGSLLSPCPKSSSLLSLYSVPTSVPALVPTLVPALVPTLMSAFMLAPILALMPAPMPALVLHSGSPVVLSSCYMSISISHLGSSAVLSSCNTPVFCCRILAFLLPLPSVLGLPLFLGFSSLRIFK